jgi:alpha-beta hydrolase superfamily lysophospholipase
MSQPAQPDDGAPGGCAYSAGWFVSPRGPRLATHAWTPTAAAAATPTPRRRLFILHGYAAHGRFATVDMLAAHLASSGGFHVHSLDFEGAGLSDGLPGLISDAAHLVDDALAFIASHADGTPTMLAGTSMGGALALQCCLRAPRGTFRGCVFLSPLVVLAAAARPGPFAQAALQALCYLTPTAALVGGSSADSSAQYRDPSLRAACEADPRAYKGRMRLATASALVQLWCALSHDPEVPCVRISTLCADCFAAMRPGSDALEPQLGDVDVPFLACHGTADTVVDVASSRLLLQRAKSADKTLIEVPDALHSLMCELPPVREQLLRQITEWLQVRAAAA